MDQIDYTCILLPFNRYTVVFKMKLQSITFYFLSLLGIASANHTGYDADGITAATMPEFEEDP